MSGLAVAVLACSALPAAADPTCTVPPAPPAGRVAGPVFPFAESGSTTISAACVSDSASASIQRQEVDGITNTIEGNLRSLVRARIRPSGTVAAASGTSGLSAGAPTANFGVWGDASASFLANDTAAAGLHGYGFTALTGFDYTFADKWVFGFDAGYDRTDVRVTPIRGPRLSPGPVIGPYASYIISPNFSVDALFDYERVSTDFTRNVITTASGSFGANRYTAAVNLNGYADVDSIALTGFVGYTYSLENSDSSVDSLGAGFPSATLRYGTIKVGGEAAYTIGQFQPYLPLTFGYQTTKPQDGTGRFAIVTGAGVRYQPMDALKFGLFATTEEARTHERNVSLGLNARYTF